MPYIKKEDRQQAKSTPFNPGELNYAITTLCLSYLALDKESYASYNEVIGVLECCKLELYRRKIVDYENAKANQNGDVYK